MIHLIADTTLPIQLIADTTSVTFDPDPWLDTLFKLLEVMIGTGALVLMALVPAWLRPMVVQYHLDKIVQTAASAALAKVRANMPSEPITFDVKNAAVAQTIQSVMDTSAQWVILAAGGLPVIEMLSKAWVEKLIVSKDTSYTETPLATAASSD